MSIRQDVIFFKDEMIDSQGNFLDSSNYKPMTIISSNYVAESDNGNLMSQTLVDKKMTSLP